MTTHANRRAERRAFTITDLIAVLAAFAIILPLVSGAGRKIRGGERESVCADRLRAIGAGLALCYAENNDYGPTNDDGEGPQGHVSNMLNWPDVLFDLDYTASDDLRICPEDQHPDYPAQARGTAWYFVFNDDFNTDQPLSHGVRTSYALNMHMSRNFKEDRFEGGCVRRCQNAGCRG